jgi:NADPH:quinone reductase-like Zn-dependent oxidoreductase
VKPARTAITDAYTPVPPAGNDAIGTNDRPTAWRTRATTRTTRRALAQDSYGGPDVLLAVVVAMPSPGPGQVRVRVDASSVNARDWHVMRGEPRVARLLDRTVFSRTTPRVPIRGTDFAGTVDAVGPGDTRWRPGHRIFGEADAAWAEYLVADQDAVAVMPPGVGAEEAAALPLAGTTALTCLSAGQPQAGDRLLINGASGGVGTYAIQMARAMRLHVTTVCSARNANQARLMGADAVIDYAVDDFCATTDRYDMVLDLVGNRSIRDLRNLLRPAGTLVVSGGGVPGTGRYIGPIGMFVRAQLLARRPGPKIVIPQARPTTERLEELADLMQSGALVPVIDRVFTLGDAGDAVRYVETEHARGKVVIVVDRADLDPLKLADREDPPPRRSSVTSSADTDLTPSAGANHTHLTED